MEKKLVKFNFTKKKIPRREETKKNHIFLYIFSSYHQQIKKKKTQKKTKLVPFKKRKTAKPKLNNKKKYE
jgi:ribosomal protein S30